MNVKIKAIPVTGRGGLQDSEMSWFTHFKYNGSQEEVRLSALGVGRALLTRNIFSVSGTHFC
jgi:hypothetical protein